ncbi:hypothetical protein [Neptuniibacter caesariensis]|uniref:Uncharacterized protein n=1 Tax=Neptuniibacter caesariensis TaxID=207954 RepID=A0A7U8C6Q2_NEPCE|nr:hypothetical protein [Neptuniibacter caesariensis]EAR62309.1 hypothetical protein MED92_14768 [Oceanospirillum sp. MED92] [Neptuniibacter caesariensis]
MLEVKAALPFVTFFLGVYLVPYIEKRKNKAKSQEIFENLKLELTDEIKILPDKLRNMASCLDNMNYWEKNGEPKVDQPWYYVPREISCYFLKDTMNNSFQLLSEEQRYAAKSLQVQIEALKGYCTEIKATKVTDETRNQLRNNYKRYLFTGCATLNTMRIISGDPKGKIGKADEEIIDAILHEIDIDITNKDLKIIHKQIFDGGRS